MSELWKGRRVYYRHTPRGGYGFTVLVPAQVIEDPGEKGAFVKLAVEVRTGGTVRRRVKRANVFAKDDMREPAHVERPEEKRHA